MKIVFIIILIINYSLSQSQPNNLELSVGLGLSGVNKLVKNNVVFDNIIKYHIKNNIVDNRISKLTSYSGSISASLPIFPKILSGLRSSLTLSEYNYKEVYYKEDSYVLDPYHREDTINTPNWLAPSFSIPYIEIGISKEFIINKIFNFEIGAFYGSALNIFDHHSSSITLWDKLHSEQEISTNEFNKNIENDEFDKFNYGIKVSVSFFSTKFIFPKILFSQGLNDISKRNINLDQHTNIWSLQIALAHKFDKKLNKGKRHS